MRTALASLIAAALSLASAVLLPLELAGPAFLVVWLCALGRHDGIGDAPPVVDAPSTARPRSTLRPVDSRALTVFKHAA